MSIASDNKIYTDEEIAANRKVWTDGLRSGEHGQCKSKLTDGDGNFCCLGVGSSLLGFPLYYAGGSYPLPLPYGEFMEAMDLAGDSGATSIMDIDGHLASLASLNDEHDYSFAEIADLIDEGVLLPRDTEIDFDDRLCAPIEWA